MDRDTLRTFVSSFGGGAGRTCLARAELLDTALQRFWYFGFQATSTDDLARATGVSRYGLYTEFSGKEALFAACLAAYSDSVITPDFQRVEVVEATLECVNTSFLQQIASAETVGLPGPESLMVNTITEVAPHKTPLVTFGLSAQQSFEGWLRECPAWQCQVSWQASGASGYRRACRPSRYLRQWSVIRVEDCR